MPKTLDEQRAAAERQRAAVCASLQRLDKRRGIERVLGIEQVA